MTDLYAKDRQEMVERQLRNRGIRDERVLGVMGRVPREVFVPPELRPHAYEDRALPLESGQTISQPYMVAAMTEALQLAPTDRVLEVGTGSGYQTAVLARLVGGVFTIERVESLAQQAQETLDGLGIGNVRYRVGDGTRGWPEEAPFDAILVTAGAPHAPPALKAQLDPGGGRLVIPEGTQGMQDLFRYRRHGTTWSSERLMACRFVPLVGEQGW